MIPQYIYGIWNLNQLCAVMQVQSHYLFCSYKVKFKQTILRGFLLQFYYFVLQFRTRFVIKLLSDDVSKLKDKLTCKSLLELQVSSNGFLDYTGSVQCNSGLTSTTNVVRQTTDSANQVMSSGNQCDNGIKKMISDSTSKCSKNF